MQFDSIYSDSPTDCFGNYSNRSGFCLLCRIVTSCKKKQHENNITVAEKIAEMGSVT